MKYDYGSEKLNIEKYGTPKPPMYKLENIKVPVHMFVGMADTLATDIVIFK